MQTGVRQTNLQIEMAAGIDGAGAHVKALSGEYVPGEYMGGSRIPVMFIDAGDFGDDNDKPLQRRWFTLNRVEEFAAGLLVMVEQLREENNA